MSSVFNPDYKSRVENGNVTTWRATGSSKSKMALTGFSMPDLEDFDSITVEDILSRDEAIDVITMLTQANELEGGPREA